ncbi:RNA 2',3'-cyclic phosphodiesterase [Candidatus Bathyarchaeota archaeon]|nr:RNA 2',3'-cyclic phosphodiesterase [Candidatus Bathyarchaeota archaeon]MBS7630563.1 RNA 2',3'-cyclic phosphodiesterase [Candidatus Bathyarchaeota archaeon]
MNVRCFVSIDIDNPDLLTRLIGIQRSLEDSGADLKTVETENIHITLMFLGDVEESRLGDLRNEITEISFKPFKIEFKGVGVFPSISKPRVIWAGISKGLEQLNLIYKDLEARVSGMGFKLDDKGFSPHVTLARIRSGRNRDKLVTLLRELENDFLGEMIAKHIRLKKSLLTSKGPIYSTITQSQSLDE